MRIFTNERRAREHAAFLTRTHRSGDGEIHVTWAVFASLLYQPLAPLATLPTAATEQYQPTAKHGRCRYSR